MILWCRQWFYFCDLYYQATKCQWRSFFLGVEVIPTWASYSYRHKYVCDLFSNTNMDGVKDISTPLSTSQSLKLVDGTASVNSSEFHQIIGSLQYLFSMHLDIFFVMNKLSQFMHKPTQIHWEATKKLLRYLKQTVFHDIQITKVGAPILKTFSDANDTDNIDD